MTPSEDEAPAGPRDVESVMLASRAMVAVAARSLADVEDSVTLPQMRILALVDVLGSMTLGDVAAELGVHASNATRLADRLAAAGLLDRQPVSTDRRSLRLVLTRRGRRFMDRVTAHRRRSVEEILARIPDAERRHVAGAFGAFALAAREPRAGDATHLGWHG